MSTLGQGLNIADLAVELKAHLVNHWNAAPPASRTPLPERQVIVPGDPRTIAWDCEQLTISLVGIGFGQAVAADSTGGSSPRTGTPASVGSVRHAVLAVALIRCTPKGSNTGAPPSAADLEAAGLEFLRDAGLLSQAMVVFAAKVRRGLGKVASVECGVVDPYGPSGGFHGAETTLTITVPDLV